MDIKSFVFLDSETTGLPAFENNRTKITELCLMSAQSEHIALGVSPRVQNKLILCFNPWRLIQYDAEKITGLSNELLENQSAFNDATVELLINFLERLSKPICLVAHNGDRFDYPILKTHIESVNKTLPDYVLCIDSLTAFRQLLSKKDEIEKEKDVASSSVDINCKSSSCREFHDDWDAVLITEVLKVEQDLKDITDNGSTDRQKLNETTPVKRKCDKQLPPRVEKFKFIPRQTSESKDKKKDSFRKPLARKQLQFDEIKTNKKSFKLLDIYERLMNTIPEDPHHAEADVKMMLECAVHLGETFINWANKNAIPFSQIKKMEPGKSLNGKIS